MAEKKRSVQPMPAADAMAFSEAPPVQSKPAGPVLLASLQGQSNSQAAEQTREAVRTLLLLSSCAAVWLCCSYLDATYTPRDLSYLPSKSLIISYQWCMVGYASNLILTLMK
jgi:hypothetical protein